MFKKRKEPEERQTRMVAEDMLKGVANRGQLEAVWQAESLVRREGALREEALALEWLEQAGLVERAEGGWKLTPAGHDRALELLRAHRLVETYLARNAGLAHDDLHRAAEEAEHRYSREGINKLADDMNRPRFDPHGDPIPERAHDLKHLNVRPLLGLAEGDCGRIAHIEDEPAADFRELLEMGVALELPIRLVKRASNQVTVDLVGESITLPHRLADHIEVIPESAPDWYPEDLQRLSQLQIGETGIVEFISPSCMGPERRRLQDFGLVPGSVIRCEFTSPLGSPTAYSLRGTTIGLREAQARKILIKRNRE